MIESIDVVPVGAEVIVGWDGTNGIPAKVSEVNISSNGKGGCAISYRCCWWNGRTRYNEWVSAFELAVQEEAAQKRMTVGFSNNGRKDEPVVQ